MIAWISGRASWSRKAQDPAIRAASPCPEAVRSPRGHGSRSSTPGARCRASASARSTRGSPRARSASSREATDKSTYFVIPCAAHMLPHPLVAAVGVGAIALGFRSTAFAQAAPEVVPPIVVHHVDAVYPPSALGERKHADVVLTVTVDADGHVSKVDVVESGGQDLDEAAVVAAREWTFVPAMRAGKPVASRIRVPFHFAPPAPPPQIVAPPPPEPGITEMPAQPAVPEEKRPPSAAPTPAPTASVEEVSVRGRATPPSVGASDFNLRVGALRDVPHENASALLKLAPGILLTNEGGEGHAEQVFLRGFDAREGQDIEFTVGGVPINESGNLHGNGYADTHFVIPELVQRLRVVEGPFDPRQGNYAVAGSADYELGLEQRGLTAKYSVGNFGT